MTRRGAPKRFSGGGGGGAASGGRPDGAPRRRPRPGCWNKSIRNPEPFVIMMRTILL